MSNGGFRRHAAIFAAVLSLAGCGSTLQEQGTDGVSGFTPGAGTDSGLSVPTAGPDGVGLGTTPGVDGAPVAVGDPTVSGDGPSVVPSAGAPPPLGGGGRITAPLQIGLTYINNQQASSSLGASDPRTNTVKQVVQALVRAINKAGGLAGRKLETVEYEWHSGDGSWDTAAASACAKFTEDNQVSVVLDEAFGTVGGFRDCLQRAGVFDITNQGVGDEVASANAPLYAGVGALTVDRAYGAVLTEEVRSGYLSTGNQLGIIYESCPENSRAYTRTLQPLISRLGLPAPKTYQFDCVNSTAGGASNGQAAISNAILRFRQPPVVDRVMFVSGQEAAALLLFGAAAESQGYRPGYLLSSAAQAHLFTGGLSAGFPPGQIPQIHGVGNFPTADVSDARPTTVDRRCLALLRAGGIIAANYDDKGQAVFSCGPILLLEALLRRTAGDASATALAYAARGLGRAFAAPGVLGSRTFYSPARRDGGGLVQTFGYTGSCACIRYSGRPADVGDR